MEPEAQRIAIAKACGWVSIEPYGNLIIGVNSSGREMEIPDYRWDLNAMHEAWKTLGSEQKVEFEQQLYSIIVGLGDYHHSDDGPYITNATAKQRAEAFLLTTGLWTDE